MDTSTAPKRKLIVTIRKKESIKPDPYENCTGKECGKGKHVGGGSWLCPHTSLGKKFPHLVKEWHPDNEKTAFDYLPYSHKRVKWICSKNKNCTCHIWETKIYKRSCDKSGCPFCLHGKTCEHNNVEILYPELALEWSPNNPRLMSEYSFGSREKVEWICSKAKCNCHRWVTEIVKRTKSKSGCPFCVQLKLCKHNNLLAQCSYLNDEWHPDNEPMDSYAPSSNKRVKWICRENREHVWTAYISCRTGKDKSGCPHCKRSNKSYSKAQMKWLNYIEEIEEITIRHALDPEGEYSIPGIGKVDGYCEENNTCYEFHGDYWHGNPTLFDRNDIHPVSKKTYGELYDKTIQRDRLIVEKGFNLIVIWESQFNKMDI